MIRSAAVLGAGTMGAQIAAHLTNAGVPVLLLDVTADAARAGLERARRIKPDPFFVPENASLIRTGSFAELIAEAGKTDWIIEAVVEKLDVKQALFAELATHLEPLAIVSTNTSGIPIRDVGWHFSPAVASRFLGTHFFNPPRYLPLVELIPAPDTDPAVVETLRDFLDRRLGKGVVMARDTPGFIANRIGLYGMARTLELVASGRYSIDEVDALTGPLIGRPKSATFRTADIAGIDILSKVARDLETNLAEEAFRLPPFVEAMAGEGATGEKAGRGFFKKEGTDILVRDLTTGGYVARTKPKFASVDAARAIEDAGARVKALFHAGDRAGEFLRETLGATIAYAARIAPEVAYSQEDVDRAMRWGFGWELGPFETAEAIGIFNPVEFPRSTDDQPGKFNRVEYSAALKGAPVIRSNTAASVRDLGDGVLAIDLHSKMNAIGGDTIDMLEQGVRAASDRHRALVVATRGPHFSAGANLMLLLLASQDGDWDEVDLMVRSFQRATMALRLSAVPVVVATGGMALGGGCEIALHGDRVQASAETYIGLVEVGVGLIPAGGGTKEMLARAMESMPDANGDLLPHVQRVFETIAFGKVSTSAPHARRLGYLRDVDGVTMNRERLIADAKRLALARAETGYQPPAMRAAIPVGGPDIYAALSLGVHLARRADRISDHDVLIGQALARILSGGGVPHRSTLSEQQVLDLEREAFLSLVGQPKTLERIAHTLKTGKMLRN
ncbi:MAG: 3-hydroxyacyl-CoA dehydrogenase NAD-binding domain-containing protein [Acidobacteriota bacterium]|nr:3-hydroxyacyl-CoA dehydrogenase NAD-binding domain-containing protein [Acidobacteriota bacterium]